MTGIECDKCGTRSQTEDDHTVNSDGEYVCLECDNKTTYLEIARLAMATIPDEICNELDISDEEFVRLRDNLQVITK